MTYKLLHILFRWDYVYWHNSADQGIARVRTFPDGTVYYWRYKITRMMDIILYKDDVIWLTCSPSKYIKETK